MLVHRVVPAGPPARVVVLGATGFIGAALMRRLREQRVNVAGYSSQDLDLSAPDSADRLAAQLRSGDLVVFASAITREKGRDIATMMRNLAMGEHVASAIERQPCAHVVYLSSDAVYAIDAPNPVSEETPCAPGDLYGIMHLAREQMLRHTLAPAGVPLAILRLSIVYGPGDTHGSYGPNKWVRTVQRAEGIGLFGGGEERRDHVYIDDVTEIASRVLHHRSDGVLNVATGHSHSFSDVGAAFAVVVGSPAPYTMPRRVPITHREYDVSALYDAFPDFQPTPLTEGLTRTWAAVSGMETTRR